MPHSAQFNSASNGLWTGQPTVKWKGDDYHVPSDETLQFWVFDSVCETPDGDIVEPDHPDSWMSILGLI